jgi:hypothetical protein
MSLLDEYQRLSNIRAESDKLKPWQAVRKGELLEDALDVVERFMLKVATHIDKGVANGQG